EWLLGAYASWTEQDLNIDDSSPVVSRSLLRDQALALFGEATLEVTDHLDLTVGLRGDYVQKSADRELIDPGGAITLQDRDRTISHVSPKLQLTWHFNDDILAYATTAYNYRPGSYSVFNLNPEILESATERNWANEVGAKASLFDHRLELSLAG